VRHRSGQIEGELAEIDAQDRELRSHRGDADTRFEQLDAELATHQEQVEGARVAYEQADQALRGARDDQRALESARQQLEFALTSNRERQRDVEQAAATAGSEAGRLEADVAAATAELAVWMTAPPAPASTPGSRSVRARTKACARRAAAWTSWRSN